MDAAFLQREHARGLTWPQYLQRHHARTANWAAHIQAAKLTAQQSALLATFDRAMNVLVLTGAWCGDCAVQCPMLAVIGAAAPGTDVRFLEQADHADLVGRVRINAGTRVPTVLWTAEDFELCAFMGDRTLARYRSMAARQLGGACPLPTAKVDPEESAHTLQGWLDEFERVQLMLRLSPRLRQEHGD
jgi:hypothetical protein